MKAIIQCPFYKREDALSLFCEGGDFKFHDYKARKEYIQNFCEDIKDWHKCTIACALENYYERKDA